MTSPGLIAFSPRFLLRAFHGWDEVFSCDGIVHLRKTSMALCRDLVLFQGAAVDEVDEFLRGSAARLRPSSEIRVHIAAPKGGLPSRVDWLGRSFLTADCQDRILHKWTFVIKVESDIDSVISRFAKSARGVCGKADREGYIIEIQDPLDSRFIDVFLEHFESMAAERGLRRPSRSLLENMNATGFLFGVEGYMPGRQRDSQIIVYKCPPYAYFMLAATGPAAKREFGQALHRAALRHLVELGIEYYDLGGVASIEPSDGIYRFKNSMGGQLYGPATEYIWRSAVFQAARRLKVALDG